MTSREIPLVGRSGLWICVYCVGLGEDVFREGDGSVGAYSCSFCGSAPGTMLVGPRVTVCAACVNDGAELLQRAPLPFADACFVKKHLGEQSLDGEFTWARCA
jgi:hypothetical protein